jgi:hypothetical protein
VQSTRKDKLLAVEVQLEQQQQQLKSMGAAIEDMKCLMTLMAKQLGDSEHHHRTKKLRVHPPPAPHPRTVSAPATPLTEGVARVCTPATPLTERVAQSVRTPASQPCNIATWKQPTAPYKPYVSLGGVYVTALLKHWFESGLNDRRSVSDTTKAIKSDMTKGVKFAMAIACAKDKVILTSPIPNITDIEPYAAFLRVLRVVWKKKSCIA